MSPVLGFNSFLDRSGLCNCIVVLGFSVEFGAELELELAGGLIFIGLIGSGISRNLVSGNGVFKLVEC